MHATVHNAFDSHDNTLRTQHQQENAILRRVIGLNEDTKLIKESGDIINSRSQNLCPPIQLVPNVSTLNSIIVQPTVSSTIQTQNVTNDSNVTQSIRQIRIVPCVQQNAAEEALKRTELVEPSQQTNILHQNPAECT